jgi:glutamate carboxypeptidase
MDAYASDLAELVSQDSGTGAADAIRKVSVFFEKRLRQLGADILRVPVESQPLGDLGDVLVATLRGSGTKHTLLCGHLDTVFPAGEAAARPFRIDSYGIAYGPGVCDDKGGALAGLYALEALVSRNRNSYGSITLVLVPDEEIGSPGSGPVLRELAVGKDQALCLECARSNGDLVVARKGVADLVFTISGRAAHAGIEPEKGASAAVAAAHLALDLQSLADLWPDVTLNVGRIRAGTQANVVAAEATIIADLRATDPDHFADVVAKAGALAGVCRVPGTTTRLRLEAPALPWATRPADQSLAERAQRLSAELNLELGLAATGGSADANHLAAVIPAVLDGLGPVGGDDHSMTEWLDLTSVPDRVALLASLLLEDEVSHDADQN